MRRALRFAVSLFAALLTLGPFMEFPAALSQRHKLDRRPELTLAVQRRWFG
jgi:hypothetical protein